MPGEFDCWLVSHLATLRSLIRGRTRQCLSPPSHLATTPPLAPPMPALLSKVVIPPLINSPPPQKKGSYEEKFPFPKVWQLPPPPHHYVSRHAFPPPITLHEKGETVHLLHPISKTHLHSRLGV